jgi:transcriptional regulator with XRE-family HTH domain
VPPASDGSGESFRGLVLQLRGRIGLTQRELARQLGVHLRSLQGWELGTTYPGVASLKALIAAGLQGGGFTAGREAEEAAALWSAAVREAPRFRTPFDRVWFEGISAGIRGPVSGVASSPGIETTAPRRTTGAARRESWGEAPDVADFVGRAAERELLGQWVLDERCRVVAVLGLGGIGKSLLASRVARDLAPAFERVIWRSLRDAPTPSEWLAEVLGLLAPDDVSASDGEAVSLR